MAASSRLAELTQHVLRQRLRDAGNPGCRIVGLEFGKFSFLGAAVHHGVLVAKRSVTDQVEPLIKQVEYFVAEEILTAAPGAALIMAAEDIIPTIGP